MQSKIKTLCTTFFLSFLGSVCCAGLLFSLSSTPSQSKELEQSFSMPAFTHRAKSKWINSAPLKQSDLKGKVVLIDFWTFECWNCYRSFPWLNSLEEKFENQKFQVIGVHTPEFEHERDRNNIENKMKEFSLHHPVMIDNDFSYWKAMNNQYWPSFYLVDKKGDVRYFFAGETHKGDKQAKRIEQAIRQLLTEE